MTRKRLAVRWGAVALLAPLLGAAAPAAAPADETANVKAAVRSLSDAVAKGDPRAVKAAVISDPRTDELLDAMAALAAANARFNAAVTAKFGNEAGFDYAEELHPWTKAGEAMDKAEVIVSGDMALVAGGEGLPPLKKVPAGWKVDLTQIPPKLRDAAVRRIPSLVWLAWALDETAKDVSGGRFPAAPPAHKAVEARVNAALKPAKGGEARSEEGDDARTARLAGKAMVKALLLGEGRAVSELYAGSKDLAPALEVFTRLREATKKLHGVMGRRFPSLVQGSRPDQVDIGPDLLEAIDAARVTIDGRTAIVKPAGDWDAMMLRRDGPAWKVVIPPNLERFLAPARATAAALEEAAAEVEAGKHKSAKEFRAALAAKVQAAVATAAAPPAGDGAATRPAPPRDATRQPDVPRPPDAPRPPQ